MIAKLARVQSKPLLCTLVVISIKRFSEMVCSARGFLVNRYVQKLVLPEMGIVRDVDFHKWTLTLPYMVTIANEYVS